jgi:hypothetical protein
MPLVAICYVKGAGGATTTALGLAAVADEAMRAVLVECDPSGGDLMRRHSLAAAPSLVDLAATARGAVPGGGVFDAVTQSMRLRDRAVEVVPAPPGGAQVRAALGELTRPDGPLLTAPRLVVADCGRLEPGSPVRPLLAGADVVLVLARARADELAHLREHLGDLVDVAAGRLVVLLTPGGLYPAGEVADVLTGHALRELGADPSALRVVGPLPTDRRAAGVLNGELLAGRRWRRLPLLAWLSRLLADLHPDLTRASGAGVPSGWGMR